MKALKPFEIAFVGLSNGTHEFQFDIGDAFFECFEQSEIKKASLSGTLFLHKKNNMIDLHFLVKGKAELTCDRCLTTYRQDIDVNNFLYVKFGNEREEQSDEILILPSTESHIDVSQYFYEYIILSLPIRHVHPGGNIKEDNCDPEVLKEISKYLVNTEESEENKKNKEKPADSRWDALKNIKFN